MPVTSPPLRREGLRSPTGPEAVACGLYERLHPIMAALGLLFLAVVLAQGAAREGTGLHTALVAGTWLLWAVFVVEYGLRLVIAPSSTTFLRRTWWQLALLAVPFLSVFRGLLFLRLGRSARVVAAALRSTRSAGQRLGSRIGWLALVATIVVFSAANLLYEFGRVEPYGRALHAAAMAGIVGEGSGGDSAVAQVLDVVLAAFSVIVFAALAGALGAYFLERNRTELAGGGEVGR